MYLFGYSWELPLTNEAIPKTEQKWLNPDILWQVTADNNRTQRKLLSLMSV